MKDIIQYWSNPTDAPNNPLEYAKYTKRSDFLIEISKKYIKKEDEIIELGCNVGRNLNALWNVGYKNLSGIDINKESLFLMKELYPKIQANIQNIKIEDFLKINEKKYDVVFTLAVFEHIPHNWIFQYVSELSKKLIITIEDEYSGSWKHFPRKYNNIFKNLGWKEVFSKHANTNYELTSQYIGRIFEKEN